MVSLILCKEYLNITTFIYTSLTLDSELNISIYGTSSYKSSLTGVEHF